MKYSIQYLIQTVMNPILVDGLKCRSAVGSIVADF